MEKLIKLLNKYSHTDFVKYEDGCFVEKYGGEGIWYSDVEVISKDFGFIQWLLNNDKIDREKYYEQTYKPFFRNSHTGNFQGFWIERGLLMLLAISDTPIEDLISLLK